MATTPSQKAPAKKPANTAAVTAKAPAAKAAVIAKVVAPAPVVASPASVVKAEVKPAVKAKPVARKAPVAAPAPAPAAAPAASPAGVVREKSKKEKLVRDSFTMPQIEYAALGEVKKACLKAGFEVKKSELLRLGVVLVRNMELTRLKAAIAALAPLKAGRPKKDK